MATERRRRSRDNKSKGNKASRKEPPTDAAGPTSVHDVPDHILELILLRLHSSACLLRAAASCKRWRRVVVADGFLSRFGSLHRAPSVAGYYHAFDADWIHCGSPAITESPVFVPSPSLAVDSRRFSLDFLPDSESGWEVADSRGSLLILFKRRIGWVAFQGSLHFPDLLVCEPLTRRYQGILRPEHTWCLGVFLLHGDHADDGSSGGSIGMSNFKVVAVLQDYNISEDGRGTPVACVFSSGSDGGWRVLPTAATSSAVSLPAATESISFAGRANRSLYWVIEDHDGDDLMVFDEATMQFSRVPLLADNDGGSYDRWSFRVIGGEDGAPRVVWLRDNELTVLAQHQGGGEWVVEKRARLPEATLGMPGREESFFQLNAMIVEAHDTFLLVTPQEKPWLFSVDLNTMHMEREHGRKYAGAAYPSELPWPPTFLACAEQGRRRRSCR